MQDKSALNILMAVAVSVFGVLLGVPLGVPLGSNSVKADRYSIY